MDNFLPREKRAIMIIQYYQLNADRFLFFYSACCVQNSLCSKILEGFYEYYNVKVKNSSLLTLQPVLLLNCCHEQKVFLSLGAISLSSLRLVFLWKFYNQIQLTTLAKCALYESSRWLKQTHKNDNFIDALLKTFIDGQSLWFVNLLQFFPPLKCTFKLILELYSTRTLGFPYYFVSVPLRITSHVWTSFDII